MLNADLYLLRCPTCGGHLAGPEAGGGDIPDGAALTCGSCPASWPVQDGLPRLYVEENIAGTDRVMRVLYDTLHRFHDPAVRYVLPLMEFGSEETLRNGYMRRLDLASLSSRPDGEPLRILEVSIGAGANLPRIQRDLPSGLDVEIWGVDLSEGMLASCRRRLQSGNHPGVRLLMADAHVLPFPDQSFDRVFHVGAIGGFQDPGLALREMARVARLGTPIVICDEQLDKSRRNSMYHKAMFKMLTWYDRSPHAPTAQVPEGAIDVLEEAVSRFYYCLSFKMPVE